MEIRNSTFIVTGGASGLGGATVEMIVGAGGNAIIADVSRVTGEALASKLGKSARFVECDVTREDHGKAAVDAALKEFRGLQGLVNCAGIAVGEKTVGKDGPHSLASFTKVININLIGTFNMIRLAADAMSKGQPNASGERGVIVNTASVAAFDGQIGQAAYAASKGGIVSMTLPIARDLRATASAWPQSRRAYSKRRCSKACRRKYRMRSVKWCLFRRGWEDRTSTRRWSGISFRTKCSTAK